MGSGRGRITFYDLRANDHICVQQRLLQPQKPTCPQRSGLEDTWRDDVNKYDSLDDYDSYDDYDNFADYDSFDGYDSGESIVGQGIDAESGYSESHDSDDTDNDTEDGFASLTIQDKWQLVAFQSFMPRSSITMTQPTAPRGPSSA